jgi:hypothetical protein
MRGSPSAFAAILLVALAMHASSVDGAALGAVDARAGNGREHRPFVVTGVRTNAAIHRPAPHARNIERNAIGLATDRHERLPERALPPGVPQRPTSLAPAPTAGEANHIVTGAVAKVDDNPARPSVVPVNPLPVSAIAVNHGAINGTTMIRPFHALIVIGGPAKTVASINGTTIRLRH